jgi:hypothetical protein
MATEIIPETNVQREPAGAVGARQEPDPVPETTPVERDVLFPHEETQNLQRRWREIQGEFVDEPRRAVQRADELVDAVVRRLTEVFAEERRKLEANFKAGQELSTEDLRQGLRRYRSFFERLLAV